MGANSAIEWTNSSWTPIRARCWEIQSDGSGKERIGWHCEHVSEGCRNCYAERINLRLGTGHEFKPGNLRGKPGYYGGGNDRPELFLDEVMLLAPLRWKKSRMIFVCSMTDAFADFVSDEWLDKIFAVMALCPQHTFQVLTKRAERMRAYVRVRHSRNEVELAAERIKPSKGRPVSPKWCFHWPLPNVWLGVSAERQQEADERIPHLLATPAAIRFVSLEPLLGPIRLTHLGNNYAGRNALTGLIDAGPATLLRDALPALDWIIVGGESGRDARPMHPDWARALRDECAAAGTAFFYKQTGEWGTGFQHLGTGHPVFKQFITFDQWVDKASSWVNGGICLDRHGTQLANGRAFALARDESRFPVTIMHRVGKKAAGRLLDGREWNEFPVIEGSVAKPGTASPDEKLKQAARA